ncbi:MAG: hypothetical protein ACREDE_02295, partial [Thermoplasmata archaeon]
PAADLVGLKLLTTVFVFANLPIVLLAPLNLRDGLSPESISVRWFLVERSHPWPRVRRVSDRELRVAPPWGWTSVRVLLTRRQAQRLANFGGPQSVRRAA